MNYLDEQFLTVNSVEGGAWLLVVVRSILGIISTINILGACATINNRLLFKISTSRRLSTATQQPADRVRTLRHSNNDDSCIYKFMGGCGLRMLYQEQRIVDSANAKVKGGKLERITLVFYIQLQQPTPT